MARKRIKTAKASVLQVRSTKLVGEVIDLFDKAAKKLESAELLLDPDNLDELARSFDRLENAYRFYYGKALFIREPD